MQPTVKNMSVGQPEAAIALGESVCNGQVYPEESDRRSLECIGEQELKRKRDDERAQKDLHQVEAKRQKSGTHLRGEQHGRQSESPLKQKATRQTKENDGKVKQSTLSFQLSEPTQLPSPTLSDENISNPISSAKNFTTSKQNLAAYPPREEVLATLKKIQTRKDLTPFRKRLYITLFSVPRGEYTTYAAIAKHLGSVARAVGNGMRNNPFAPEVPCHRVLASDGTLGGFCGDWGPEGKHAAKKLKLLGEENVKFDSRGKVKGPLWDRFWDLEDFEKEYGKVI